MLERRIVPVDDRPLFRSGLKRIFEQDERLKDVAEATSGHEALPQADIHRPALVLMDVQLPGVTGRQIGLALRRHRPVARIVFLSVHGDEERLFVAIRVRAVGFLTKDADRSAILEAIYAVLPGGEPAAAGGVDQPEPGPSRPRRVPLLERAFGGAGRRTRPCRRVRWRYSTAW